MMQKLLNPSEEHNSYTEPHGSKENWVCFFFFKRVSNFLFVCIL